MPNGDPPEPFTDGTGLCAALLLPPLMIDGLGLDDTEFLGVYFLHADELQLKLDQGLDALLDVWDAAERPPTEIVEPDRPSAVAPRRLRRDRWRRRR